MGSSVSCFCTVHADDVRERSVRWMPRSLLPCLWRCHHETRPLADGDWRTPLGLEHLHCFDSHALQHICGLLWAQNTWEGFVATEGNVHGTSYAAVPALRPAVTRLALRVLTVCVVCWRRYVYLDWFAVL